MKRASPACSPSPAQGDTLLRWALGLFALPLALFLVSCLLQYSRPQVFRIDKAERWVEPLGQFPFDQAHLAPIAQAAPDFSHADWQPVSLPDHIALGSVVDLPDDAPKARVWFRLRMPAGLLAHGGGSLGLMGNRIMGGPWSVWVNGSLVYANLADWRMQWNTPMRVSLPPLANKAAKGQPDEILLGVPYPVAKGYAVGSVFIGQVDAIDMAWQARNRWQSELPKVASAAAFILMLMALQLALGRPQERLFGLLSANAAFWCLSNTQFFFDFTGQDRLSAWFGMGVDASINWIVVLNFLFAFEFEQLALPRLRAALLLFACATVPLTLPIWPWHAYGVMAQNELNALIYVVCCLVLSYHVARAPRREGVILCLAFWLEFGMGLHDIYGLTNQTRPDEVFLYPLGGVSTFIAFVYAINRRALANIRAAELHQTEMRAQLLDQARRLTAQHTQLQQLEVTHRLAEQQSNIMQDLHDRLGSNLTSALLQARSGALAPDDTVLLLQDLTDELRDMARSADDTPRSVNDILAELRQRMQHRLKHGGITLRWAVDLALPTPHWAQVSAVAAGQHLRALLSEAMANVIKHAGATHITLSAQAQGEALLIALTDDGRGFDPASAEPGRGLPGMQTRAHALGAHLQVDAAPGQGCRWRLTLPLQAPAQA